MMEMRQKLKGQRYVKKYLNGTQICFNPENNFFLPTLSLKAAAERRKKIMAAIASQQKTFMTENATLFEETPSGLRDHKQSMCEWELEEDESAPVCLGPGRSAPTPLETNYTCILCQVGSFS